jgi:putative DNA primase/helicase
MTDPVDLFRIAIEGAGMAAPAEVHGDGRLHRFSPEGKRRDDAGWYVLHLDNIPAGTFGNWRTGESQTWCAKTDTEMTPAERVAIRERVKAAQRLRDAETMQRHADAADKASHIWAFGVPAVGHPYLKAKNVKAHGLRVGPWQKWDRDTGEIFHLQSVLYVPMRDTAGKLHSLQGITGDGEKLFLSGGKVKGMYHSIGRPSGRLVIGEGLATCSTVHEATGDAVAVAFNSGNLEPVARALRVKYPCLSIVIAADDDWKTPGNPGLAAARAAAGAVGGTVAIPDFAGLQRGPKDTDHNDLARLAASVKAQVPA